MYTANKNVELNPSPAPNEDSESVSSSSAGELGEILAPCGHGEDFNQLQVGDLQRSQMEHARLLAELAKVRERLAALGNPLDHTSEEVENSGGCYSGAVTQTTASTFAGVKSQTTASEHSAPTRMSPIHSFGGSTVQIGRGVQKVPHAMAQRQDVGSARGNNVYSDGGNALGGHADNKRKLQAEYVPAIRVTHPSSRPMVPRNLCDEMTEGHLGDYDTVPCRERKGGVSTPSKMPKMSFGAGDNLGVTKEYISLFENPEYLGHIGKQICDIGVSSLIVLDSLDGSKRSIASKLLVKMEDSLDRIRCISDYFWKTNKNIEVNYYPPLDKAWTSFFDTLSVLQASFSPYIDTNVTTAWYMNRTDAYSDKSVRRGTVSTPVGQQDIAEANLDAYFAKKDMKQDVSDPFSVGAHTHRRPRASSSSESDSDYRTPTYPGYAGSLSGNRRSRAKYSRPAPIMSELPPSVGYVSPITGNPSEGPKGRINAMHLRSDHKGSLQLSVFTGREDFESWYEQFCQYREIEQWEDELALNKVLCSLRDEAHAVVMSIDRHNIRKLPVVIQTLVDTFRRDDLSAVALKDFTRLKLSDCEGDFVIFASRLQELYKRANPQATEKQREAQVKYQFFTQVPAYLQVLCSWQSGLSVRDLANKCADSQRLTEEGNQQQYQAAGQHMPSMPPPAYQSLPTLPNTRGLVQNFTPTAHNGPIPAGAIAPVQVIGGSGPMSLPTHNPQVSCGPSEPMSLKGPQSIQTMTNESIWNQRVQPDLAFTYGDIKDAVVEQLTKLGVDSVSVRPAVINAIHGFRENQAREPESYSGNNSGRKKRHCIYCDMDGHEEKSCFRKICHSIYADCIKSLQTEINVLQREQKDNDSLLLGLSKFMIEKHGYKPDLTAWAQKFPGESPAPSGNK